MGLPLWIWWRESDRPGTLIAVGTTPFGGFAQLAIPVIAALYIYWIRTTRGTILASVLATRVSYMAVFTVYLPAGYHCGKE